MLYQTKFNDGENFTMEQLKHVNNIKDKCLSSGNDCLIEQMGLRRIVIKDTGTQGSAFTNTNPGECRI